MGGGGGRLLLAEGEALERDSVEAGILARVAAVCSGGGGGGGSSSDGGKHAELALE